MFAANSIRDICRAKTVVNSLDAWMLSSSREKERIERNMELSLRLLEQCLHCIYPCLN